MINPHLQAHLDIKLDEPIDPVDELMMAYERLEAIAGEKETRRFVEELSKWGNMGPEIKTRAINAKIADLTEIPY